MLMTQQLPPAWGRRTPHESPGQREVPWLCPRGAWGGSAGSQHLRSRGRWPKRHHQPLNRWKSPKFWLTAVSRVTTVPRALGIRQRKSGALRLILFFFLQCRTKEVASSFVQNTLLPCVQQVLCYRSAAQLHPFAWLQQAQHGCTAPHCTAGRALGMGQGTEGILSPAVGIHSLPLQHCKVGSPLRQGREGLSIPVCSHFS